MALGVLGDRSPLPSPKMLSHTNLLYSLIRIQQHHLQNICDKPLSDNTYMHLLLLGYDY